MFFPLLDSLVSFVHSLVRPASSSGRVGALSQGFCRLRRCLTLELVGLILPSWVRSFLLLFRGYSDDWTLTARNTVSSVAAEGNQPVEPGGHLVGRTLQQTQLRIEDLERIRNWILRLGQDKAKEAPGELEEGPDPRRKNLAYKLEGEAASRAAEALRKGADAARGRGRRKGRLYQRTGARN